MKTSYRTSMLAALMIAASVTFAPVPGFAQNIKQMTTEQLLQGKRQIEDEIASGAGNQRKRILRQINRELRRRKAQSGGNSQQQQQQQEQAQPQQEQQPTSNVNRQARQYLRGGNVRQLGDNDLRRTVRRGRELLQDRNLRGNVQRRVRQRVQAARAETARRKQAAQQQQQQQQQQGQQQEQQQQSANVNRQARRYLRGGNVRNLSDNDLRRTVRRGRDLLKDGDLRGNLQRKVRERVQAARGEENRRKQATQQQQQQQQQQGQQQEQQQQNVNRQARRYLRGGNVRDLSDNDLRRTVRRGRDLLKDADLRGNLQRKVRERVQAARGEENRRNQTTQQPQPDDALNAQARRLLNDTRSASSLGDRQLRRRLGEARRIMGNRDLDRRLFRQVRRMARADRTELRERVARRDTDRVERAEDRQDARQLLRDRRSARELNDRQLQARIKSARDLLGSKNLRPGQKDRLEDLLREARREKRRRLIAERERRREKLRANRANNQVIIEIPQTRVGPDRDDIDAAEADDALLQRQLVAPPRRRIERKFSRQDIRSGRSSARRYMPAIEVDTIRFGFNEAFVREEEIPQLERIGEIIERIVAGNRDEVFLIEGHTDAVGSAAYNQGLSAKRANAVRDAMLQFFNIDRSNIETVGYGEEFLKIDTEEEEQENRRVTIRRITPLLASQ